MGKTFPVRKFCSFFILPQDYDISLFGYVSTVIFDTVTVFPGLGSEFIGIQPPFGRSVGWDSLFFVLA